ncbi:MAG: DUF4160 domain-containing protein [Polyangiaceae bacterium]|nr:DUF4160 domain-containing protein [Polyangiaceae bacterium]
MPEISRFYGIVVRMFHDEHPPPHFHAYYQDIAAVVRIDTLEIVRGSLPGRAMTLVAEWALAHRDELRQNWARVESGEPPVPIEPLD